jgi:hypothetical protein
MCVSSYRTFYPFKTLVLVSMSVFKYDLSTQDPIIPEITDVAFHSDASILGEESSNELVEKKVSLFSF